MALVLPSSITFFNSKRLFFSSHKPTQSILSPKPISVFTPSISTTIHLPPLLNYSLRRQSHNAIISSLQNHKTISSFVDTGLALTLIASITAANASASEIPLLGSSLQLNEPQNALSLPTWAIHVSSVVEWITAMVLVWQYGEKSGYESWKGLSWGMVPLLGGAFCACTWHFFYNSESLSVLVALQAALTVIGNFTMCIAAFRIYKSSQRGSENL